MSEENQGWKEWSNHVLKELERLNSNYENIREEVSKTNTEITKVAGMKHALTDIKDWKTSVENVVNIKDLELMKLSLSKISAQEELLDELKEEKNKAEKERDEFKTFITKSKTISVIVFFLLTTAITVVGWFLA